MRLGSTGEPDAQTPQHRDALEPDLGQRVAEAVQHALQQDQQGVGLRTALFLTH